MCLCCGKDPMDCDCFFCDLCGACTTHGNCGCYVDADDDDVDDDDEDDDDTYQ